MDTSNDSNTATTNEIINPLHMSSAVTHPLQEIALNEDANTVTTATARTASPISNDTKKNWVKFDDDVNEQNNNSNNNIVGGSGNVNVNDTTDNARAGTPTALVAQAPTAAAVTVNKLSPILQPPPPRPPQPAARATSMDNAAIQRPRTPTETAPVQRLTVSAVSAPDVAPAVLTTESTHVNLNASGKAQHHQQQHHHQHPHQHHQQQHQKLKSPTNSSVALGNSQATHHSNNGTSPSGSALHKAGTASGASPAATATATSTPSNIAIPIETTPPMRTIELSTGRVREGFANGDVIVTLLPANTKWPWITPAIFRPELVPEELMAQGLTLTVEEYVSAMETLVNDYRFTVYNICYKRILVCWIFFAFVVLLALLFSGLQGVALFSLGVFWLFLNASAIFICMWIKMRLSRGLEKCLARVNKQLMKHKILLLLDDRGRISCHKVNLCFMYFDPAPCVNFLNGFLEQVEQNGGESIPAGWESKLDIDVNDIVIQGSNPVRLSRRQERGVHLFLRYGSRWGREALRGLVDATPMEPGRHCRQFQCACQYIKEHLQYKPRGYPCSCIAYASDPHFQNRY